MKNRLIIALDGHDGAGKTTLSKACATSIGGTSIRPFSGAIGLELLKAGEQKDVTAIVNIGRKAITEAIANAPSNKPIVLDRAWMTLASFIPDSMVFFEQWNIWIPTALCWANLPTTTARLALREDENEEPSSYHKHYLAIYHALAKRTNSMIIRTDECGTSSCIEQLATWIAMGPPHPYLNKDMTI